MENEINYIAGLFDGEGSVGIGKVQPSEFRRGDNPAFYLEANITNTSKKVLDFVKAIFGGKIYKYKPEGRLTCYKWRIWSMEAAEFLRIVFPYLIIKSEAALIGIFFQLNKGEQGNHGPVRRSVTKVFEEMLLYDELKGLHERGYN